MTNCLMFKLRPRYGRVQTTALYFPIQALHRLSGRVFIKSVKLELDRDCTASHGRLSCTDLFLFICLLMHNLPLRLPNTYGFGTSYNAFDYDLI